MHGAVSPEPRSDGRFSGRSHWPLPRSDRVPPGTVWHHRRNIRSRREDSTHDLNQKTRSRQKSVAAAGASCKPHGQSPAQLCRGLRWGGSDGGAGAGTQKTHGERSASERPRKHPQEDSLGTHLPRIKSQAGHPSSFREAHARVAFPLPLGSQPVGPRGPFGLGGSPF